MVAMKLMNVFILTIYLSVVMDPTACSSFVLRYQGRTKENCHQLDSFHYAPNKALRTAVNSTARYMQLARGGGGSPPKLSQWIGPALMSALSYALYNLSIKIASKSINPVLGGVILQVVAAMLGSCLLGVSHEKLNYDRKGLLYSIFAGIAVGMAEILSFQVSASGVEASKSIPVMIGGSVAFGSVLGFAVLRERMTIKGWFGVLLVVLGIVCVATDPGVTMSH